MFIRTFFAAITLLVGFAACQNQDTQTNEATSQPDTAAPSTVSTAPPPQPTLPSIPLETVEYLWANCDYVDYVFYELPISMSLDNQRSVQYVLQHISDAPAPLLPECKPIGRIFYQVKGENVLMADLYFSQGCTYFVFLENDKPKYANYMTEKGVAYLNDNFKQAQKLNTGQ